MKPASALRLSLLDQATEGSMTSMAETPFDYTSSDDVKRLSSLSYPDGDRTKKLSVRISNVVDVNIYSNEAPHADNSSLEECHENEEEDDEHVEKVEYAVQSHYDVPTTSARKQRISESDSVLTEDSSSPEMTLDGKTLEDCIAMMDDGTLSVGSHASEDSGFGLANRSKSFLNLFFGSAKVCSLE